MFGIDLSTVLVMLLVLACTIVFWCAVMDWRQRETHRQQFDRAMRDVEHRIGIKKWNVEKEPEPLADPPAKKPRSRKT